MEKAKRKKIISLTTLIIGSIALIVGIVFLVLRFAKNPELADGDYLVSNSSWTLENNNSVVWNFTEIGKGTLTTNNHQNDYNFIWSLENEKLKIETSWLYDLENEYLYELDKSAGTLTLTSNNQTFVFKTAKN